MIMMNGDVGLLGYAALTQPTECGCNDGVSVGRLGWSESHLTLRGSGFVTPAPRFSFWLDPVLVFALCETVRMGRHAPFGQGFGIE